MPEYKEVALGELFDARRGFSAYTRAFGISNPGPYPVYSAALRGPLAHIDRFDHVGPCLTFTTNGYGGTVQIVEGAFCVNGDRAVLIPKSGVKIPDLRYLRSVMEPVLRPLAVGRRVEKGRNEYTKLRPDIALSAMVPLLADKTGALDYAEMLRRGIIIERSEKLQQNISSRVSAIANINVLIECAEPFGVIELGDEKLFQLSIGNRVVRGELDDKGAIPVYSANARAPMGFQAWPVLNDVSRDSLIWGIDGIFDWNMQLAGSQFIPTDHCGRAEILSPDLDAQYLLHELRSSRDGYGFDRVYRANLQNIRTVTMRVPLTKSGAFDVKRQRDLAAKHEAIERTRKRAVESLQTVLEVAVALG